MSNRKHNCLPDRECSDCEKKLCDDCDFGDHIDQCSYCEECKEDKKEQINLQSIKYRENIEEKLQKIKKASPYDQFSGKEKMLLNKFYAMGELIERNVTSVCSEIPGMSNRLYRMRKELILDKIDKAHGLL